MRQVATEPRFQGQGIGFQLIRFAETIARSRGYTQWVCHARSNVVSFYEALGFERIGPPFEEVGIEHFRMEKAL